MILKNKFYIQEFSFITVYSFLARLFFWTVVDRTFCYFSGFVFFWKKEKIKLRLLSLSYIFSFLSLCLTTSLVKYETGPTNPAFNGLVEAQGFPMAVLTDDAGMTDMNFHAGHLILNLVFYFIVFAVFFLILFRKKLKNS